MFQKIVLLSFLAFTLTSQVEAATRAQVCVRYEKTVVYGNPDYYNDPDYYDSIGEFPPYTTKEMSKAYNVIGVLIDGSELNNVTHSFDYYSYDKFLVIFWDKDQASIIKANNNYDIDPDSGEVSYSWADGIDKRGVKWEFKDNKLNFPCH